MNRLFFILIFFISINVFAKNEEVVTVKGEAAIVDNDKLSAKDKALDDAMRKAVEQTTGVIVSSESLTQNFELISDKIYTKAKGYISKYNVIKEGVDPKDDGVYFIEIKATVSKDKIQGDLSAIKILYNKMGKPRFLLMIAEQNFGEKTPSGWWSNVKSTIASVDASVISELTKKGFKFVDGKTLQNKLKKYSQFKNIDGVTAKDIISINTLHNADYVITGKVIVTITKSSMQNKSVGIARGTLKIIKSSNGEVIDTLIIKASNNNAGVNEVEAGEKAFSDFGKQASLQIEAKVLKHWLNQVNSSTEISIKIKGLKYKIYKKLKAHLLQIRGLKSVDDFKMENKIASMRVNYKGTSNQLLDAITNKPLKGLSLELETVNGNEIIFSVEK
jgi:phosphopantetheine adenylyltransferase